MNWKRRGKEYDRKKDRRGKEWTMNWRGKMENKRRMEKSEERKKGNGKEERREERMRKGRAKKKERKRKEEEAASLSLEEKKKGKDRRKGSICGLGLLFEKNGIAKVSLGDVRGIPKLLETWTYSLGGRAPIARTLFGALSWHKVSTPY